LLHGRCLETDVVSEPFASKGSFSGSRVLALIEYATTYSVHVSMLAQFVAESIIENKFSIHVNRKKVLDCLALNELNRA
jgi:hypothetical protein